MEHLDYCPDALAFFVSRTILIHSTNFVHLFAQTVFLRTCPVAKITFQQRFPTKIDFDHKKRKKSKSEVKKSKSIHLNQYRMLDDFEDSSERESCAESYEHFSIPNPAQNYDNGWP